MTLLSKSTETATAELRWLDVGGMRPVLQQKWVLEIHTASSRDETKRVLELPTPQKEEVWRDVPTVQKKR